MSRIGKKEVTLPAGVTVEIKEHVMVVKGPKGELRQAMHPHVAVKVDNGKVLLTVANENDTNDRALWGTFGSLLKNMIIGVTAGFKKQLEIAGVGFKANMKGANLILEVGFSHSVEVKPFDGVKISVEKNIITVEGLDKQRVGEMTAQIRAVRKPEPYKGKGIKYIDEVLRHKEGKTATKGAAA